MQQTSPTERVAASVRAEMARNRLPQRVLADALGTSQASVSRRLSGEVPFDVAELAVVARLLGVPMSLLVGERIESIA